MMYSSGGLRTFFGVSKKVLKNLQKRVLFFMSER